MADQPSRKRRIVKRVAWSLAAVVLVIAMYAAGAPIVLLMADRHYQPAFPFLDAIYTPLRLYANNPDILGSKAYNEYAEWCTRQLQDEMIYDPVDMMPEPIIR